MAASPTCLSSFAKTDPDAGGKGISAFLVEPGFKGFRIGRHEEKMGAALVAVRSRSCSDGCEVPVENRVGEEGQGLKIALSALDNGRIGIAAQAVGVAQGALEAAAGVRQSSAARSGKSIAEFQAIQWMLADMQTEIEAARGLVHHAAWLKDSRGRMGSAASKAKLYATEMANRVAAKAVQIHGSIGRPARDGRRADLSRRPCHDDLRGHERDSARDHCARVGIVTARAMNDIRKLAVILSEAKNLNRSFAQA